MRNGPCIGLSHQEEWFQSNSSEAGSVVGNEGREGMREETEKISQVVDQTMMCSIQSVSHSILIFVLC